MKCDFLISGIPHKEVEELLSLDNSNLELRGIKKLKVKSNPGYPCRVSLQDAEVGEEVLAFSYTHQAQLSPYQSSGPVFIRVNAQEAQLEINEIPEMLNHRLLSLRTYDREAFMIDARAIKGEFLEEAIQDIFANKKAAYIHVHNTGPGCYNCQINRVQRTSDSNY